MLERTVDDPIYLDHNATTPVAGEVADAMIPWLGRRFGNPSSRHAYGRRAAAAVAVARRHVAALIGAHPDQVVWTSGGTEANNIALRTSACTRRRVVTSAVEHPAVEEPAAALQEGGWSWDRIRVDRFGRIDLADAATVLEEPVGLLSTILAQNETGVVQPVQELVRLARRTSADVVAHADGAQAVGKVEVDVDRLDVDLLTVVSHKLYGPCGVGALFVRRPELVSGWVLGGGQERRIRPGTEPTALVVGFGEACRIARRDLERERARQEGLRELLWSCLRERVPRLHRTSGHAELLPNTLHVCFPSCSGARVLDGAPQVAASTGSACHSAGGGGGTLGAMGVEPSIAQGAVRLSLGRNTRPEDVEMAAHLLANSWKAAIGHP